MGTMKAENDTLLYLKSIKMSVLTSEISRFTWRGITIEVNVPHLDSTTLEPGLGEGLIGEHLVVGPLCEGSSWGQMSHMASPSCGLNTYTRDQMGRVPYDLGVLTLRFQNWLLGRCSINKSPVQFKLFFFFQIKFAKQLSKKDCRPMSSAVSGGLCNVSKQAEPTTSLTSRKTCRLTVTTGAGGSRGQGWAQPTQVLAKPNQEWIVFDLQILMGWFQNIQNICFLLSIACCCYAQPIYEFQLQVSEGPLHCFWGHWDHLR